MQHSQMQTLSKNKNGGMLFNAGAAIMGSKQTEQNKIMLNIEDVMLHEEKLYNVLEVSNISL